MSEIKVAFEELRSRKKELEQQFKLLSEQFFAANTKELFTKHGTVQSISWRQYTPYFNDGDTCTFRVCTDEIDITYKIGNLEPHTEDFVGTWAIQKYLQTGLGWDGKPHTPTLAEWAASDFVPFLGEFEDELMLSMFGDHVRVTVHRDGRTEVDSYEHD